MIRNHEAEADSKPSPIIHFSRLVRGTFLHWDWCRRRRRHAFQITYSVAVASAAETYRSVRRTTSEWIKEDPPAVATLVIPRASFIAFIATRKAHTPWIAALVSAANESLIPLVGL